MLKGTGQELGRLESIFLEILEDPSKKEVLLYPICYCQLVRKESDFEVNLSRLISCASKTFHTMRGKWQDIFLELDIFQVISQRGDVLYGKDILRLGSPEGMKVSFLPEYREIFYEVYARFLKYWTVLSKVSSYSRRNSAAEITYLSALIFNEELYGELVYYAGLQAERFPEDSGFLEALKYVSEFYIRVSEKKEPDTSLLKKALLKISNLGSPYYGINVRKFRKDLELLIRDVEKSGRYFVLKVSFTAISNRKKSIFRRVISGIVNKIRRLGGRRWTLISSEAVLSSFTETSWRGQSEQRILA
ncbi:MAG TPA: hypothetical protein EYP11_04435 [Aquificaceae bacterium]|nr:hypothetical protein [Aquificaceae bacterium]